ncbi:MAG: hypothetical protein OEV40_08425 [Acidimicrobiia bacterium]|nr:hypothetical protein [Acidimicrobiia bacterium]
MRRLLEPGEAKLLGPFYAYMFMAVSAMAVFTFNGPSSPGWS